MPPVLGPRSPSRIRLKSCAGWSGRTVVPSVIANSETSGPSRYSSITTGFAALRVGQRLGVVGGDHHALAGREAVVLHDVRRTERVERGLGLLGGRADERPGRRHAGGGHHVLGERLRALQPRGLAGGSEDGDAAPAHGVRHPGDQRRLGADDDQVDAQLLGQVGHGRSRHRVDVVERGEGGDARVARRGVHLGDGGVARQRPHERVLAATGADHECLHRRPSY